jgi:arylamine N-acetyltransferase
MASKNGQHDFYPGRLLRLRTLCKLSLIMDQALSRFLQAYSVKTAPPELDQLRKIAGAFSFLPYENVTKIIKEAKSGGSVQKLREAPEVLEDHLRWRTGGTCFSLSNTLHELLKQSGFSCFIAMADMHYGQNIHCAVIAESGNKRYLLDPGYLLSEPMLIPEAGQESRVQTVMNTVYLKSERTDVFSLYTEEHLQRKWRYRLRATPVADEEFTRHWVRSFSLNSMESLMLSRLDRQGRIYFRKNRLEVVSLSGREKKMIGVDEVHDLASLFGVPADLILQAHNLLLIRP